MSAGKISASGQQHVQFYRKVLLRKRMLRWAVPGAAYCPFIGDGDLAAELYPDRYIMGADLDPNRVHLASTRLRGDIRISDCDLWPFSGDETPVAIADFDAYADPYTSFRAFWAEANKLDRMVLFFTDGLPQAVIRSGSHKHFDGSKESLPELPDRARSVIYNAYLSKYVWPDFERYIQPYRVLDRMRYRRQHVVYWACAIERGSRDRSTRRAGQRPRG